MEMEILDLVIRFVILIAYAFIAVGITKAIAGLWEKDK